MKHVFNAEGLRQLRTAWVLLFLSLAGGAAIVWGTHWYFEKEKRDSASSERRLREARARLDTVRRERDSLQES